MGRRWPPTGDGLSVGVAVGASDGATVGTSDGRSVGLSVGTTDGSCVALSVGASDGNKLGARVVGARVGDPVGTVGITCQSSSARTAGRAAS